MTSPYLDRPCRTYEEAKADLKRRRGARRSQALITGRAGSALGMLSTSDLADTTRQADNSTSDKTTS